jgi:hypothetical protein
MNPSTESSGGAEVGYAEMELDFSDGVTSAIVLGREVNAANEAWERWAEDTNQPYHKYACTTTRSTSAS